jgi:hypothetical protein
VTRRTALFSFAAPALLLADRQTVGKQLLADALAALGGPAFLAMNDRTESGRLYSFYRERLAGLTRARIYTRYGAEPKPGELAVRERQSYGKDREDYAVLFEETAGYQVSNRGARPLAPDVWERYQDTTLRNIFYILRHRRNEPGLIVEHKETGVLENQPVEVLDITDTDNRLVTVYLQRTTKLPLRQVFYRRDAMRYRHEEISIFAKYRDVGGGAMWPWNIVRNRDGEKAFEIFSEQVTTNDKLDAKLFELPADMPRLKAI